MSSQFLLSLVIDQAYVHSTASCLELTKLDIKPLELGHYLHEGHALFHARFLYPNAILCSKCQREASKK